MQLEETMKSQAKEYLNIMSNYLKELQEITNSKDQEVIFDKLMAGADDTENDIFVIDSLFLNDLLIDQIALNKNYEDYDQLLTELANLNAKKEKMDKFVIRKREKVSLLLEDYLKSNVDDDNKNKILLEIYNLLMKLVELGVCKLEEHLEGLNKIFNINNEEINNTVNEIKDIRSKIENIYKENANLILKKISSYE